MIDLYTWTTPNGRKVSIALEEMQIPYRAKSINIAEDEQFAPDFLRISPNNKIPAILDHENGLTIFESGAILVYLAEKSGRYLAKETSARSNELQWLNWQIGGFGPMLGQLNYFLNRADKELPEAITRFTNEAVRLYNVLDGQLAKNEYVAEKYSIADMAIYPWSIMAAGPIKTLTGIQMSNVERWHALMGSRPAVQAGMAVPEP